MILVTGGTGLTGSHLLLELVLGGENVRVFKRASGSTFWVEKVFEWYRPDDHRVLFDKIEWIEGDLNDFYSLREAVAGVKKIYHCAALVSYAPSDRAEMHKVNVEGTANLVNVALRENVEKICHCSSIASLSLPEKEEVVDESFLWKTSPHNTYYAISKFGAEREIWRGSEEGLDMVMVNPSIIIGPGDPSRSSGLIFKFLLKGLKIYTGGVTGFVDVRDVAAIMVKLMNSDIKNERFIINSENVSYKELFVKVANCYGTAVPKYRAGKILAGIIWRLEWLKSLFTGRKPLITKEIAHFVNKKVLYSNDKISNILNYRFIPVDDAVSNTCGFFKWYYDK